MPVQERNKVSKEIESSCAMHVRSPPPASNGPAVLTSIHSSTVYSIARISTRAWSTTE